VAELNPRQREIYDELLLVGQQRPSADRTIAERLRARAGEELGHIAGEERLSVNKHKLGWASTCPGYLRAKEDEDFEWRPANVRGKVIHRAMESLILSAYRRLPLEVAQAALDDLAEGDDEGLAEFLRSLGDSARHDLVRDANDRLVKFVGDWPPIGAHWYPRIESPAVVAFGRVTLRAAYDLALGIPNGDSARTFIVDFKTGDERDEHRDQARFYALVETLRSRTSPFRVATYYLDSGDYTFDDVDAALLEGTLDAVVDTVRTMATVHSGAPLVYEPGFTCRWCPARPDCADGQEWLAAFGRRTPTAVSRP
jgi:hypothetical protein